MERVTFTNERGETIVFDQEDGPYFLESIEGTGNIDTETQMQKAPYQDGQTLIEKVLDPRDMPIIITITAETEKELYQRRAFLTRILNSKLKEGTLKYEYPGGLKEIKATVDSAPMFPTGADNKGETFQVSSFSFLAPNPFWYDPTEEEWTLASFEGGFSFPFSFPFNLGTVGKKVTVENKGDVDTPLFINFKGPLTNPVIENLTTGKKITVTKDILEGETLEINTEFGNKSIILKQIGILRELPNGTKDEVVGEQKIQKVSDEITLDGSWNWGYVSDHVGYKVVKLAEGSLSNYGATSDLGSGVLKKDNGVTIPKVSSFTNSNEWAGDVSWSGSDLSVTIADIDSGWAEGYAPTVADIKSYFNAHPYKLVYQLKTEATTQIPKSNVFHYIDPTSELFSLIPGENELSYTSTASSGDAACSVKFKNRYIGV